MNDILRAVILGVVQGLTEFLPVSSTGHMILTMPLLGIHASDPDFHFWNGAFDIFIQLGSILAVLIYCWRRLCRLTFNPSHTPWYEHFSVKLLIAFLPAIVVGYLAHHFIEEKLKVPSVVACALIVGGILILVIQKAIKTPSINDAGAVSLPRAAIIGLIQCLSLIPGTSRSGATIMGALSVGMAPAAAAEFSFFLAIPTMFAAGLFSLYKHRHEISSDQLMPLAVGFAVSFVVAWAVVAAFMRFIQTHRFTMFAIYRIALGVIVLAWVLGRSSIGSP
ncbi:MAG TPA: undecaprenyl-diphosphate phosphatase [Phycisphaerae bacterium]|nr:undecaprenyl-diphosphate phosphatase [Phycisphaerae bacterium]HRR87156.1 undecaprenyl-diphosphate phosphatase [Phycisphaerae bacterium]